MERLATWLAHKNIVLYLQSDRRKLWWFNDLHEAFQTDNWWSLDLNSRHASELAMQSRPCPFILWQRGECSPLLSPWRVVVGRQAWPASQHPWDTGTSLHAGLSTVKGLVPQVLLIGPRWARPLPSLGSELSHVEEGWGRLPPFHPPVLFPDLQEGIYTVRSSC